MLSYVEAIGAVYFPAAVNFLSSAYTLEIERMGKIALITDNYR